MTAADTPHDSAPADRRNIAVWLLICCAMVAAMVVIGGITRLTESGLSMTEWRPLIGWIPPLSDAEWHRVFERYRQTSEFRMQFPGMDVEGFKTIFWWEYIHRVWGRLIGLAFGLPLAWFLIRGRIGRGLAPHLVGLFVLGGLQGLIGWWMVTSGFVDREDVSQYRLVIHLGTAVLILGYMLWIALGLLPIAQRAATPAGPRRLSYAVLASAFVTMLSGGLVAGINAGLIYNTWPLMDGGFAPYDIGALSPWWLNLFENHATVQFDHRMLAYLTAALALAFWLRTRRAAVHDRARRAAALLAGMVGLQIVLGVSTLLLMVPVPLGVLHQAGAVAVFALALWNAWEQSAGRQRTVARRRSAT